MAKKYRVMTFVSAAVIIAAVVALLGVGTPASAQVDNPPTTGPTPQDCFSDLFHAASDCDRLASDYVVIPATGASAYGPTITECYTDRFHAATDCDRLASELLFPITRESAP